MSHYVIFSVCMYIYIYIYISTVCWHAHVVELFSFLSTPLSIAARSEVQFCCGTRIADWHASFCSTCFFDALAVVRGSSLSPNKHICQLFECVVGTQLWRQFYPTCAQVPAKRPQINTVYILQCLSANGFQNRRAGGFAETQCQWVVRGTRQSFGVIT